MTANTLKGDKENFVNTGMTDCIGKPFKVNELSMLILNVTKNK